MICVEDKKIMKIIFLGTRGNIKVKTTRHERHTITIIEYKGVRVAIDCGLDWINHIKEIHADAFVITHAHDDHIGGFEHGSPAPVYATQATWQELGKCPIKERVIVEYEKPFNIGALQWEAFFVEHSYWAFAVGYRITAGRKTIFCVHDLMKIKHQHKALENVDMYIGDGASFNRPIIRYKDGVPFGHTTIKNQIDWCKKMNIPRAIFTHCGSQIVKDTTLSVEEAVIRYGELNGVETLVAYDGMTINV